MLKTMFKNLVKRFYEKTYYIHFLKLFSLVYMWFKMMLGEKMWPLGIVIKNQKQLIRKETEMEM